LVSGACTSGSGSEPIGKASQAYHAHCDNGTQDVDETATDCGGLHCKGCGNDQGGRR